MFKPNWTPVTPDRRHAETADAGYGSNRTLRPRLAQWIGQILAGEATDRRVQCLGLFEVDHMRSVGDDYERRAGDACVHVTAHDVGG